LQFPISPQSRLTAGLLEYWQGLRGERLMPRRSELDPGALKPILPYIWIQEVRGPNELMFRLAGTATREMFGVELTTRNQLDLTPSADRRTRSWRHWNAANRPCGSFYHLPLTYSGVTKSHEGLWLPIAPDREGSFPLLLGLLVPIKGTHWLRQDELSRIEMAFYMTFFDIGAGTPDSIEPPEEYTLAD
jgi:hypothetical protein